MFKFLVFTITFLYSFVCFSDFEENLEKLHNDNSCSSCNFSGLDMSKLNFQFSDMSNSIFENTNLIKSSLQAANISNSSFKNSTLVKAELHAVKLDNSVFF